MSIITLLSDFGLRDSYVAEMKGVILSIKPDAVIIDITHQVEPFNVRMGAYILARAAPRFPPGTIHVAVVDPGVGTSRRSIVVEGRRSFYVGPDNGLLVLAAKREGVKGVYEIRNPKYLPEEVSGTFHGRDIFSRVAAYLAKGVPPSDFGPELKRYVQPSYTQVERVCGGLVGEVVHIDNFGNVVTNISEEDMEEIGVQRGTLLCVDLAGKGLRLRFCSAYGEVPIGTPLAIIGSGGFLELSINQGDAARKYGSRVSDRVEVTLE